MQFTLTLATGDEGGNYHNGGLVLKEFAAKQQIDINLIPTDGSYENVMKVGHGEVNLGLAQMDVLVYLNNLSEDHKKASQNSLVIAPIELEYVHILVNNKSNIKKLEDIKSKKIGTGSGKSGTSFTFGFLTSYLFENVQMNSPNFLVMDEGEAILKVANGELDAAFLVTTLGSKLLARLPEDADVRLLSFSENEFPEKIKNIYSIQSIPDKTYPWQKKEVTVPAILSFFIVSKETPEEPIKKLVKIIYENEDKLDSHSEIWSEHASEVFDKMTSLNVPYHPEVKRYLKKKK